MNQEQLDELLEDWQVRLRLMDWEISVEFKNYMEVDAIARCRIHSIDKSAEVEIVPEDQLTGSNQCTDIEVTLVHELLHVKSEEAFTQDLVKGDRFECFIEHLAAALVYAKRSGCEHEK